MKSFLSTSQATAGAGAARVPASGWQDLRVLAAAEPPFGARPAVRPVVALDQLR